MMEPPAKEFVDYATINPKLKNGNHHFPIDYLSDEDELIDSENNEKKNCVKRKTKWNVEVSDFARLTHNPIRAIVENLKIEPHPEKIMIALSIGEFFLKIL